MKQAYMIITHSNLQYLQELITMIDSADIDIYIHIDKKTNLDGIEFFAEKSNLFFVSRRSVYWGHISQIECELACYQEVINSNVNYSYVHLISGQDILIKPIEEISAFFDNHYPENFIEITQPACHRYRLSCYHIFAKNRRENPVRNFIRRICFVIQLKVFRFDRLKIKNIEFYKGSNRCSLTLPTVKCVVDFYLQNRDVFLYSIASDESYKQMAIMNSKNKFEISNFETRYIDWSAQGASPKILGIDDYDKMIESGCLFARKVDGNKSRDLIEKLKAV